MNNDRNDADGFVNCIGYCRRIYSAPNRLTCEALNHVSQITGADGSTRGYRCDATGNRTQQTANGTTITYTIDPASNRVTQAGSAPYRYDANGSRTAFGSTRIYTYDAAGRLASYTGNGHDARYQYNGLGERVAKTVDGTPTYFIYDEAGHLIGEYDAAGTATRETVYLGDLPLLVLSGSTPYYVHADWRNTPRQLDNAQQQAVWAWDPPPFGDSTPNSNPQNLNTSFTWNARFPGQYWDDESRLFYNYQRTYDPTLGRYLESDPTGLSGGINPYSYASGDPINLVDPDGLLGRAPGRGPYPAGQGPGQSPAQFAENVKNAYLDYRQANLERFTATLDAAEGGDPEAAIQLGLGFVGGFACTTKVAKGVGPKVGSAGGEGAKKAFPNKIKDQARKESNDTCVFCGTKTTREPGPTRSEIDHAIPKSRGGNNTIENAQNTCRTCNRSKEAKTTDEFLNQ